MAEIAEKAGLPKATFHYYFGTKEELYRAVFDDTLSVWLTPIAAVHPGADPAEALTNWAHAKIKTGRERPHASRVCANKVLHAATQIERYLSHKLRRTVEEKVGSARRVDCGRAHGAGRHPAFLLHDLGLDPALRGASGARQNASRS
jgi:AcrR family transcriptional regulator